MTRRSELSTAAITPSQTHTHSEPIASMEFDAAVGINLGRYMVISPLGRGGMATVYAAYDPKLDRKVAIKVMHGRFAVAQAKQLLLREAQSLAKLSHPNIVTVHDVGVANGQLFLVMEHVRGLHLRQWAREHEPTTAEILRVLIEAGQGLAAVHRAGIVHCDVKPDNILLGEDGRVQVADFGLAQLGSTLQNDGGGPSFATRAYLAPEVFEGGDLGFATDIYAFCVCAIELLVGKRPGPLSRGGGVSPGPRPVPRAVLRILAKGLCDDPKERPRSMAALVSALQLTAGRTRRWVIGGLLVAATATLTASAALSWNDSRPACETMSDELVEYWKDHRYAVTDAIRSQPSPLARTTADQVEDRISGYVKTLGSARVHACEVTRTAEARGEYSEDNALATACLEQRKDAVTAWIDVLAHGDLSFSLTLDDVQLPELETCHDPELLAHSPPPPADREQWTSVATTRRRLGEAAVSRQAGMLQRSATLLSELGPRTAAIDYTPLRAEFELERGRLYRQQRQYPLAEAALYRAVALAETSAHDMVRLEAWIELTDHYGEDLKRLSSADVAYHAATAALRGLGSPRGLQGRLDLVRGRTLIYNDRFREGCDRIHTLLTDLPPSVPPDRLHGDLGFCHWALGEPDIALDWYQRAYQGTTERLGPEHPEAGRILRDMSRARLSAARGETQQIEAARQEARRAHDILAGFYGERSLPAVRSRANLGRVALAREDLNTARTHLEAAVLIIERDLQDENAFDTATIISMLGSAYSKLGLHAQARARHEQARAMLHGALGPTHSRNAIPTINLAYATERAGDPAEAILLFQDAWQLLEPLDRRRAQQAKLMFTQAKLLWDSGVDLHLARQRALEAIEVAQQESAALPDAIRQWLDAHPAGPLR